MYVGNNCIGYYSISSYGTPYCFLVNICTFRAIVNVICHNVFRGEESKYFVIAFLVSHFWNYTHSYYNGFGVGGINKYKGKYHER